MEVVMTTIAQTTVELRTGNQVRLHNAILRRKKNPQGLRYT